MGKNFSDFTYGVGLEITAQSFKQVKDDLKLNLNSLAKMIKSYDKILKIDPNADLSKLFDEMRQMQSIIDGINSSSNSFGGFVDKGTLGSVSALEERLKNIDSVSEGTKAQLNELKSVIATLMEPLKEAGKIKFPATFENLFTSLEDPKEKIKAIVDEIAILSNSLSELKKLSESATNIYGDTNNKGTKIDINQLNDLANKFFEIKNKLADISNMDSSQAQIAIDQFKNIGVQLANAMKGFSSDRLLDIGLDESMVVDEIDNLVKSISTRKEQLSAELTDLKNIQKKFAESKELQSSSRKSAGLVSDVTAQVKVMPKANDTEWANTINDTIKNVEPLLKPVHLTPTFSKSKNISKEIEGNLAQINHTVGVELKVNNNLEKFNQQINNIDTSIKNAKQRLEQNGNFRIKFEYEEGGNFKDVAYKIINQLKHVEVHVDSKTSANFIKELGNLRTAANKELKNIKATVKFNSFNNLMKSVDTLKAGLDEKLSKKDINLYINNESEVISKATLIRDRLTEVLGNIPVNLSMSAATTAQATNPSNVNVEPLSESALKAKENLERCKQALESLTTQGFNSKWFLELGNIGPDGKKIKDAENKLESLLNKYKELKAKTPDDVAARWQELYPEANGDRNIAAKMAKEASEELKKVEAELNGYLQKQIAYTQSRYEQNQKILQQEKEIVSTQQQGSGASDANKKLAMSAEEASKKVKSLNGTLTQQKKFLEDLETNGINSKSLISLGNWDKDTQSFKKNKNEIQELVNRYHKLKAEREKAGGTKAVGEEASLRGKLGALLKQQKQHVTEIIAKNQEELEAARKISAAYKEAKDSKTKAIQGKNEIDINATEQKISKLTGRLKKANEAIASLQKGLTAVASTGIGDKNNVLKESGREETLKQLVSLYEQLTAKKKEFESVGISKQSIPDMNALVAYLKQAQQVLDKKGFFGLTETGLGDVKGRLSGSSQSLEDLVSKYRELLTIRQNLRASGDTTSESYTNTVNAIKGIETQLQVIRQDQTREMTSRINSLETEIAKKAEYMKVAKECNTIEGILADVHKNQVEYAKQRIAIYQQQIAKEQELLNIARQRAQENANVTGNQPNASTGTTNTSAQDTSIILTSINEKVGNILSKLNGGLNITGSNITIEAGTVSVTGSVANATGVEGNASASQQENGNKKIASSAEVATKEQKALNNELEITTKNVENLSSATKVIDAKGKTKKETETYRSADKVNERIETSALVKHKDAPDTFEHISTVYKTNLEAFNKLRNDYVTALTKQKEIEGQIAAAADGPKAKLEAELEIQKEITQNLESQINAHKELYTEEKRAADIAEAERKAQQNLNKSAGAQSDRNINKQNNELIKIIDSAQAKYDEMQRAMNTSKVPMADAAISKFKEYESLLVELKAKQQELNANPKLMDNEAYKTGFDSLLQKMKDTQSEFSKLQKSSEGFLSRIHSLDDIKVLDTTFDPHKLDQMHTAMQDFANQIGVGSAKLIEFNDVNRTGTFEIKNAKGQIQQITVEYDAATNSLGRYVSHTRESTSATQKFINSLKASFQNVARYIASFGSVYRIFATIKKGFTYIKEIDSALTELKKVTDETDASYNRFLQDMSKTGRVIGATVKDLTTMAAEWARLGYSMQEAGKLAQSTAVLLNVSEFSDATKASEALISTMQAFQYTADQSERVVDILNEVGKLLPVDNYIG